VELLLVLGIVLVTTAFSAGDDYTYTSLPSGFHARKRIDCHGNDCDLGFIASLIASSRVSKKLLD
jgi:hypothetical protein